MIRKSALLFTVILLLPTLILAQQPGFQGQRGPNFKEKIVEKLGLTGEQSKALEDFREKRDKIKQLALKIQIERLELNQLLKEENFSEDKVQKQLEKVNQAMINLNNQRVENLIILRKSLTKKQFSKLMSVVQQGMQKGHGRPHGGNQGGFGMGQKRFGGQGPGGHHQGGPGQRGFQKGRGPDHDSWGGEPGPEGEQGGFLF